MSPEETDLARLLVALPGWRWVPGMASGTGRVYLGSGGVICWQGEGDRGGYIAAFDRCADLVGGLPDLHDPATAGILLGMLAAIAPPDVYSGPGTVRVTWSDTGSADGPCLGVAVARGLVAIGRCA